MFHPHTLLALALITLTVVDANPVARNAGKVTHSMQKIANKHEAPNIIESDQARMQTVSNGGRREKRSPPSVSYHGPQFFFVEIGIGEPPTNYKLIVDTGSSNTWIGALKPYVTTDTSQDTDRSFSLYFEEATVQGQEWQDTVTLVPGEAVLENQYIGVASHSTGIVNGVDGILGLGPVEWTADTVSGMTTVPTVMDTFLSQSQGLPDVLGLFIPPTTVNNGSGEITYGGHDDSRIVSSIAYTPLVQTQSRRWVINQAIVYDFEVIKQNSAGFLDSGMMLTYLASDAFKKYRAKTGATYDKSAQLYWITPKQYSNLDWLAFDNGDETVVLTADAQILPRSTWGTSEKIYLAINDIGVLGTSVDASFILGYTFHQRYYTVYDITNQRIGFATTAYTAVDSNWGSS